MAFFTQAKDDGTIDRNVEMSEEELRNAIIARVTESNAWERHKMLMHPNDDAKITTIAEEGGFSEMEKTLGKKHEDVPAINYDPHTKNFVVACNCGKEKFVFDIKNDNVETESAVVHMKEMDPYKKDNQRDGYGRDSGDNPSYDNRKSKSPDMSYGSNSSQQGMKYKN